MRWAQSTPSSRCSVVGMPALVGIPWRVPYRRAAISARHRLSALSAAITGRVTRFVRVVADCPVMPFPATPKPANKPDAGNSSSGFGFHFDARGSPSPDPGTFGRYCQAVASYKPTALNSKDWRSFRAARILSTALAQFCSAIACSASSSKARAKPRNRLASVFMYSKPSAEQPEQILGANPSQVWHSMAGGFGISVVGMVLILRFGLAQVRRSCRELRAARIPAR